jgi:hypothetical protein
MASEGKFLSPAEMIQKIKELSPVPATEVNEPLVLSDTLEESRLFKNVTFKSFVHITHCTSHHAIQFIECTFEGMFTLEDRCELTSLTFKGCTVNGSCTINQSIIRQLNIESTFFKEGIRSSNLFSDRLKLELVTSANARFNFTKPHLKECHLFNLRDASIFAFSAFDTELMLSVQASINLLHYNADSEFTGCIILHTIEFNSVNLAGFNKSGRIIVQDCMANILNILQFTNTGLVSVSNLKTEAGMLMMLRSNMGKCELFDIDFTSFNTISIDNSNIQEIIPTNITWCRNIESNIGSFRKHDHLRETYRQLKNVMIRQNDKVQELMYHELEMDNYLKSIAGRKGHRADRFIIRTNQLSNKHGLSYVRPALILLITASAVYTINKWLLGFTHPDSAFILSDIALYFESLNPIRKFSAIYGEPTAGWKSGAALLLDVLFRLLASYLIFQFISAFRKYVKK